MKSTFIVATLLFVATSALAPQPATAQGTREGTFQGFLTDTAGVPIDGLQTIVIRIFDAEKDGTQQWARTFVNRKITNGYFDLELDSGTPAYESLQFDDLRWIELEIGGEVISPRTLLTATPLAAGMALPIEAHVSRSGLPALVITNTSASLKSSAIYGESEADSAAGVHGNNTGSGYGVYGESIETFGRGVYGLGTSVGVYGETVGSVHTSGVVGIATDPGGTLTKGVEGLNVSDMGYAGYFSGGYGVRTTGGTNAAPDLILGGNLGSTDDDGRIYSDPSKPGSDIWLHSNDAVVIVLDDDGDGEDADFWIEDKDGVNLFNVDESGEVRVLNVVVHASDRNMKEDVHPVDPGQVLEQVVALPVHHWKYKGESVRHMGPMAQDFHKSFSVGSDERFIAGADAQGVALAAIQGLYALVAGLQEENREMRAELDKLTRNQP